MILKEINGLKWLQFFHLSEIKALRHGILLKHGGVSQGFYESLNLGFLTDDLHENVTKNLSLTQRALDIENLFWGHQRHGCDIIEATFDDKKSILGDNQLEHGDAWVTKEKNLGLVIRHADCQAAIFYDPIEHALANVHCGWRGNVQNIYQRTIDFMKQKYRCRPKNLLVGISPSLGPQAAQFINYKNEFPVSFWEYQIKPFYFDLWEISKRQLIQAGVLESHIEIAQICTYSNPQDWFSHRYNPKTGRNATIAKLI